MAETLQTASVPQLISTIKTLAEKAARTKDVAERYYTAAGTCLRTLKQQKPDNVSWEKYVKTTCGISQQRADELIRFADGRTTLESARAKAREGMRRLRSA